MSGKSVIGGMIGSIAITLAIIWGLGFAGFFPGVDMKNVVIQTKYGEWNSPAYIFDNQLSYVKMEDTELTITASANSRLLVSFSAMSIMTLDAAFTYRVGYNISLVVEKVGNRTIQADYYDGGPAYGYIRQISMNLYINYLTPNLPAGTYKVEILWKSGFDATGTANSLSVAHMGGTGYNFTRTILIQELRG
ncbi:MAG: hypothetical protein ACFFCI_05850 [Promethearchaeota archaeon]